MTPGAEHDVVVIGAGHNGLVAACYLADAGLDVLVVEANEQIGGMSSSGTPIPAAPHHVVNYCAGDLLIWQASPVERELALHRHGLRTVPADPSYAYLHPDGASLAFWRDPRRTADEIRRFSKPDAEAYLEYARFVCALFDLMAPLMLAHPTHPSAGSLAGLVRQAARHRRELKGIGSFVLASGEEVIDARFRHPVTQAALHCLCAGTGPIDTGASSLTHILLGILHRVGAVRPVGGMQALPAALAARLRAHGGSVVTGTPVSEILLDGGRAGGVGLADGREFRARRAVLAACDPRTAFERLLPPGTLGPELDARVRAIPTNRSGTGQMKVDLALSGRVDLSRHHAWRDDGLDLRRPAQLIGTPEGNRRSFARCGAGLLPATDDLLVWSVVLTGLDESQAPTGQDSLYLYCAAVPVRPDGGWKDLEPAAADAIVSRATQFFDGIAELEIGRYVETPESMATRTGATDGCVIHVDFDLFRSGPLRPALALGGYRTPIPSLYLGSAGSHPGGGVTGMPGRGAAKEILRTPSRIARWSSRRG